MTIVTVNGRRVLIGNNVTVALLLQSLGYPARGIAGDAAVRPEDVSVRLPVDWDSVDPIPDALAEIMRRPGAVDVPLDDVVPDEPAVTQQEVRA